MVQKPLSVPLSGSDIRVHGVGGRTFQVVFPQGLSFEAAMLFSQQIRGVRTREQLRAVVQAVEVGTGQRAAMRVVEDDRRQRPAA